MTEDAPGAYNPIIQAMIATAHLQKQGQQQEIEKERNKQEAAARKEQLKHEEERIKNEHEHQLASIELQGKQHQLQAEAAQLQRTAMIRDLAAKGVDVGKLGISGLFNGGQILGAKPEDQQNTPPHVLPQNASPLMGSTPAKQPAPQQDISGIFPGPAQEAERVRGLAAAESGGKAQGEMPFEQEKLKTQFGFQKQLQDAAHESQLKIAEIGKATQYDIAKLSRSTQMAIANMDNKTRLQIAGMGGDEQSQNLVKSLMLGGATGEIKLNPANPLERLAYSNLQQQGFQEVDPKQAQAAKEAQKMLPLFDRLEKFANQLPESTGGAMLQGAKTHGANLIGMPTKLQNDINLINSQAMVVGKAVEGLSGRPLSTQLKLDLDTLAAPGITRSMMKDRIKNLRDNYVNAQQNVIFSGMPKEQQEIVSKKWGLQAPTEAAKPDWLRLAPKKNKSGHSLDEEASQKFGQPVYK